MVDYLIAGSSHGGSSVFSVLKVETCVCDVISVLFCQLEK